MNQTVENVWIPDAKGRDWPQNEPKLAEKGMKEKQLKRQKQPKMA